MTHDPNQRIADINESQKGLCAQVPVIVDAGDHDSMALGVIVAPRLEDENDGIAIELLRQLASPS